VGRDSPAARVKAARDAFLGGGAPEGVRSEILASWRRSEASGVDPDRLVVPFFPDLEPQTSKLFLAAEPVLRHFADRLEDTHSSIVLADRQARILGRWSGDRGLDQNLERASVACGFSVAEPVAGTNGLGTALEEGRPAVVQGGEHFVEPFMTFTCIGSPIRHPITHHIEGGVNIACRHKDTNSLVLPMVLEMTSAIEEALYRQASDRERALFDSFLRHVRSSALPTVAMSEQFMFANAAAARLLDGADQVVLWEQAYQAISRGTDRHITLTVGDRLVDAHCAPVELAGRAIGVRIELSPTAAAPRPPARAPGGDETDRGELIGVSRAWRELETLVHRTARTSLPVLFIGESGTGKATLARHAHRLSGSGGSFRAHDAALVAVDGTEAWLRHLRDDLTEPSGTVFVHHLDLLDGPAAAAVCALLDHLPDEAPRLSAATLTDMSADPAARMLTDRFVVRVAVPPLRERPEDVGALAAGFCARLSPPGPPPRITAEAVQALLRLDWPGNVRQLRAVIARIVAGGRRSDIGLDDLPEDVRRQTARLPLTRLEQLELEQILVALRQANGNKVAAAQSLGISRATLYRKIGAFGLRLDQSIF
jgi:sigma-54 dependent transcriptional regulator, acetoin dehydrogenase operon transcriptional activator AcoR